MKLDLCTCSATISHARFSRIQPWESRMCISVHVGGDVLHLGGSTPVQPIRLVYRHGRRRRCGISSQTKAWALFTFRESEYSGSDSQRQPWTSWRRGTNTCRLFVKLLRNKIANVNMSHQWGNRETLLDKGKQQALTLAFIQKPFFLTHIFFFFLFSPVQGQQVGRAPCWFALVHLRLPILDTL